MTKVYILCGVPYSGKSTMAKKLTENNIEGSLVIENDVIREELALEFTQDSYGKVIKEANKRTLEAIKSGVETIVLDGTNMSIKTRRGKYDIIKQFCKKNNIDCEVEVVICAVTFDEVEERQKQRERFVPLDVCIGIAKGFNVPVVGVDCDKATVSRTLPNIKITEYSKHKLLGHRNVHHLETVGRHIVASCWNANNRVVMEAMLCHDLGKPYCITNRFGLNTFFEHDKVSAYLSLSVDTDLLNILNRAMLVEYHMGRIPKVAKGHVPEDILAMLEQVNELDGGGRFASIMAQNTIKHNGVQYKRVYKTGIPIHVYFKELIKFLEDPRILISEEEVLVMLNDLKEQMDLRSAVIDVNNNVIAHGLPTFFNENEFVSKEEYPNKYAKIINEFMVKHYAPKGEPERVQVKYDGSFLQIFMIDGEVCFSTRNAKEFNTWKGDVDGGVIAEEILEEAKKIWKTFECREGETLLCEVIGKKNKIVCEYNFDLKIIPFQVVFKGGSRVCLGGGELATGVVEGVVKTYANGQMTKCKTPEYFERHKIFSELLFNFDYQPKRVLKLIHFEEFSEILAYCSKEDRDKINGIVSKIEECEKHCLSVVESTFDKSLTKKEIITSIYVEDMESYKPFIPLIQNDFSFSKLYKHKPKQAVAMYELIMGEDNE